MSISYAALNRTQRAARARLMIDGGTLRLLLSTLCSDLDRLAGSLPHPLEHQYHCSIPLPADTTPLSVRANVHTPSGAVQS